MAKKTAFVSKESCVACGVCLKECPLNAISVFKGCYAFVDSALCVGCAKCARVCPAGCITVKEKEAAQ